MSAFQASVLGSTLCLRCLALPVFAPENDRLSACYNWRAVSEWSVLRGTEKARMRACCCYCMQRDSMMGIHGAVGRDQVYCARIGTGARTMADEGFL